MHANAKVSVSNDQGRPHTATRGAGMPSADGKVRSLAEFINKKSAGKNNVSPDDAIQPKLKTKPSRDKFEQEADAVADRVLSSGNTGVASVIHPLPGRGGKINSSGNGVGIRTKKENEEEKPLQRQAEEEEEAVQTQEEEEGEEILQTQEAEEEEAVQPQEEEEEAVQPQEEEEEEAQPRRSRGRFVPETLPGSFKTGIRSSNSGGQSLPAPVLEKMEHSFNTDFSHVRVHTDHSAAGLSRSINAQAFTKGSHVYFNENRFQPDTPRGRHLIAHELTHVVQQGHAQTPAGKTASPHAGSGTAGVQRLGMGVGAAINRFVRYIPGWTLFTVIVGYNPLIGQRVGQNATNLLGGILGLVPVFGTLLFDKLREHHIIDRAYNWLLAELNRFGLNRSQLEQLITDTYNRLDLIRLDTFSYNRNLVVNAFRSLYNRVRGFASSVSRQILTFIKEALLAGLRRAANAVPGYDLFTMILGRDPLTGQAVLRNTTSIIERFLILIGQRDHARKMRETGTLQQAADWIDTQLALLNFSFAEIQNLFSTAWNAFSFADLRDPIGAFRRTVGIFAPFLSRVATFAWNVARQVLIFIKDAMMAALNRFARRVPGYLLLSVILGRDPIAGTPVVRTPTNFIGGFMEFVPGGRERFRNLQESGAIDRMFEWLSRQVLLLDLSVAVLVQLFCQAWQSLSIRDLLNPLAVFQRMANLFGPFIGRIIRFALAVGEKILEFVFEGVMGTGGARVLAILKQARSTFLDIVRDPMGFLGNLINALARGFRQFGANILTHLRNGLIGWLTGTLGSAGIQLPERFDLKGILSLVLQILGLTYARLRPRLVRALGERNVSRLERAFEFVRILITEGPAGLWRKIVEGIQNLRSMIFDAIRNWVITRIVTAAVTRLATMFNPAGAVIQAILAIYNTIMFLIERMNQIMALVQSVVQSIASIAAGNIAAAADFVEQSMARTVPVIISFLARLMGLGGIGAEVLRLIRRVQGAVGRAVDRALRWIITRARRFIQRVGGAVRRGAQAIRNFIYPRHSFRAGQEQHTISFSNNTPNAEALVASGRPRPLSALLQYLNTLPENQTSAQQRIVRSARSKERRLTRLQNRLRSAADDAAKNRIRGQIRNEIRNISTDLARLMQLEEFATEQDPLKIPMWPKPASSQYPIFYIGPRSAGRIPQDTLARAKESGDASKIREIENSLTQPEKETWINNNRHIERFEPHGTTNLNGTDLGIKDPYRVDSRTKMKLPRVRQTTPGGSRFNNRLRPFGYSPSEENLDADHVLEIQMGGQDVVENLWPLNSSVNRSAGGNLSRMIFPVPNGSRVPISVLKQRAATKDVWLEVERTL